MSSSLAKLWIGLALIFTGHGAFADELQERLEFWKSKAFLCEPSPGNAFPSRPSDVSAQPCDDGDITLFNGLMCAAGNEAGCAAVADAQNPDTGEWFRSPRIRRHGNDRGGSSFSPDMALGVELYLVKTHDIQRASKWLLWLDSHVACSIEVFGNCLLRALPRFCTDDVESKGCTMRPGDAAELSATVTYLQDKFGLATLPDGRLRGYLGTFAGYSQQFEALSSQWNDPGYSRHLVGVAILLLRMMEMNNSLLDSAASELSSKEPKNAFFSYLAVGKSGNARALTLELCPSRANLPIPPLKQWQWERTDSEYAGKNSCYWDCIFMADLLK